MNKLWYCSDLYLGQQNCSDLLDCWSNVVFEEDVIFLLGNIAVSNKSFWFNELKQFPGRKVLFLGDLESNRPNWYEKFGFETIIPFNQTRVMRYTYGNIMFSHLPAYESVQASYEPGKYLGLVNKFNREFDSSSCIMNIHGHTNGKAQERDNTIDVSYANIGGNLPTLEQLIEKRLT